MPDMTSPALPRAKYTIHHRPATNPPYNQCVHFITFGLQYGHPDIHIPPILSLDLSKHEPPREDLCARFTGLDDELQENFLSFPANDAAFRTAWAELWRRMKREPRGRCVLVKINCAAGMHRSVAMAERLAEQVRLRDGYRAECLHLDLAKGGIVRDGVRVRWVKDVSPVRGWVKENEIVVRRVREASPIRGQMRESGEGRAERGEGRAREEARVRERYEGRGREEARVSQSEIRVRHVGEASPTRGRASERGEGTAREEARVSENETRVWRVTAIPPTRGWVRERGEGRKREDIRANEREIRVTHVRAFSPMRGRVERGEGRAREETRVSGRYDRKPRDEPRASENEGLRRPKDQDHGVHSRRPEKKTVSWGTSVPVRESYRRQGENGDGSAGPAGRDEERRR